MKIATPPDGKVVAPPYREVVVTALTSHTETMTTTEVTPYA